MELSGARKAALLLASLDPVTAGELLKSAPSETLTQIVAEIAVLESGGEMKSQELIQTVDEFFGLLHGKSEKTNLVKAIVENAIGKERSLDVLNRVDRLVQQRDPFVNLRQLPAEDLAKALSGESAQVVALVFAELSAKKSTELLNLIDEALRKDVVTGMVSGKAAHPETRLRVAEILEDRLKKSDQSEDDEEEAAAANAAPEPEDELQQEKKFRRVALLLRGLKQDARVELMTSLSENNAETSQAVQELMVIWEDLPMVAERAMQEVLRMVNSSSLALALIDAHPAPAAKIRDNISERANAALDEEISLLSGSQPEETEAAREEILKALRAMNDKGDLKFEEAE